MKYILNTSTNTYHIEGCCHNSFSEKKVFNTENEVIKYGKKYNIIIIDESRNFV